MREGGDKGEGKGGGGGRLPRHAFQPKLLLLLLLLLFWLLSHPSHPQGISQGRMLPHLYLLPLKTEAADQTCHPTKSVYSDVVPASLA